MNNFLQLFLSCWVSAFLGIVVALKFKRLFARKPFSLESYAITMTEDTIPRLGLILQSGGQEHRLFIDAPYALKLADELTMAAVRAAPKSSIAGKIINLEKFDRGETSEESDFHSLRA